MLSICFAVFPVWAYKATLAVDILHLVQRITTLKASYASIARQIELCLMIKLFGISYNAIVITNTGPIQNGGKALL